MKIMKVIQIFLNKIIAPLVVGLLLFLITGVLSQINTGNYWRFFARIPLTVWIIIGLIVLIWIMITVYRKKLMRLESKISKFEIASKVKPIVRNNAYWLPNKDGTEDGPFCTKCWDDDTKQIRLNPLDPPYSKCPKCKNIYQTGPSIERERKTSNSIKFLNEP
jgi:hypothetical protein